MSGKINLPYRRVIPSYASVTERYYTPRFVLNVEGKERHDQCVLFHSNKLCLVALAPSHPILFEKKTVTCVSFKINDRINRLENHVSGRWKKGGQKLQENSLLCNVTCSDGSVYPIFSCLRGTLMEANENLTEKPSLLTDFPWSNGYIAIVMVPLNQSDTIREKLLSEEKYLEKCQETYKTT